MKHTHHYTNRICRITILALFLLPTCQDANSFSGQAKEKVQKPVIDGTFIHIFNPNDSRNDGKEWYTNDHCFAQDESGTWHAYGIIGYLPIRPWVSETRLFHISSPTLMQSPWTEHEYALVTEKGSERVLWAPTIFQEKGISYMFYNTGNMQENAPNYCSWGQLRMATSPNKDMMNWERHKRNPLFSDPGHARDSYVTKHKGTYYFYYTRTVSETDRRSAVAVRTSKSLTEWSGPEIVHIQPLMNDWGGDAESPTVIYKDNIFYLFICRANTEYNQTDVYWSHTPLSFPVENLVCTLPTHAPEIIRDKKGNWFISDTGWDKKGLFIAPLKWE